MYAISLIRVSLAGYVDVYVKKAGFNLIERAKRNFGEEKDYKRWALNVIILFALMSIGTLFITYFASKKTKTAGSFYTAGGGLTARQNGLALAGDFMSASTFLGLIGAFSLTGYDGFFLMYGALVSFLVVLFLVAEPLRNLGKYTLARYGDYEV